MGTECCSAVLKDENYKYGIFVFIHVIQLSVRLQLPDFFIITGISLEGNGQLLAYNMKVTFYSSCQATTG
jgi:hypothetical protein